MAQINITLNEEQILQLLCSDRDEAFRYLLQEFLNNVMKAESAEQLNAQRYERTEEQQPGALPGVPAYNLISDGIEKIK